MILENFPTYSPHDFVFKIAKSREDLDGFFSVRRDIFCEEQGIFVEDDRDLFDESMIPIVCKTLIVPAPGAFQRTVTNVSLLVAKIVPPVTFHK